MADKDVQPVKMTGALWDLHVGVGIIRDILAIIVLLAILVMLVIIVPQVLNTLNKVDNLSSSISGLASIDSSQTNPINSQNQGGSNLANNSITQNISQSGIQLSVSQEAALETLGLQMYNDVNSANWSEASNDLSQFSSIVPQTSLTPAQQQELSGIQQAIQNQDKGAFNAIFSQVVQNLTK